MLASALLFALLHILPGDPATLVAGDNATPADLQRIHKQLGLDRSLPDQYLRWIGGLFKGDFGKMLGLDNRWAYNIIKQVGNYGESFERHLTPLGVDRGINKLWNRGGLMYAPPIR